MKDEVMRNLICIFLAIIGAPFLYAQQGPPRDNPYDVIGRVFQPFWSVLLADIKSPYKAVTLTLQMTDVSGRLSKQMRGATLQAASQFPDKVKLEAPVLGEQVTVCRNGNEVWAIPGKKVEFLLDQFKVRPIKTPVSNTPLFLPITAQQAVFLPALFSVINPNVAEVDTLNGEDCRIITAGLMPELAQATKSEDFRAQIWVATDYVPRRVIVARRDFTATVDITNLRFSTSLPASTWQPPAGATDIYRTTPEMLQSVLFVVMNSLKMKQGGNLP